MTRDEATTIREEIQAAVDTVLSRHGMTRMKTTLTYGDAEGRISLQFSAGTSTEEARKNKYADEWNRYADLLRLDKSWLGTEVTVNGSPMTIVGLSLKNRKYPVIVENRRGKQYKVDEVTICISKRPTLPSLASSLGDPQTYPR